VIGLFCLLTPYFCSQKSCGGGGGVDDERYRLLRAVTPQLLAAIFKTEMEAEVMTGKPQAAGLKKQVKKCLVTSRE